MDRTSWYALAPPRQNVPSAHELRSRKRAYAQFLEGKLTPLPIGGRIRDRVSSTPPRWLGLGGQR